MTLAVHDRSDQWPMNAWPVSPSTNCATSQRQCSCQPGSSSAAQYIRDRQPDLDLPWTAYIGVVYAARQLASDALETAPEMDLSALVTDLNAWIGELLGSR